MRRVVCLIVAIVCVALPVIGQEKNDAGKKPVEPIFSPESYAGLTLRGIGPAFMSGRISDIVIDPTDRNVWYVAVGSGGVWKTVNAGVTWDPIFDDQASYSIGCLALDPKNPNVVWVGTGENVSGRHVGFGDGIYRSLDGGKSWKKMGLKDSQHISRIAIDPRDSNVVYVAAEGNLWAPGGERGLYKSTDGGATWKAVLTVNANTGVTDVIMQPGNPDVLIAAAYQRERHVSSFMGGGPDGGLYKSTDAGATWRKLASGLPKSDVGKIGLAWSPMNAQVVYATIESARDLEGRKGPGGFFRSSDAGESWEKRSDYFAMRQGTGPHYYMEINADPTIFDRVYQMDVRLMISDDGGRNWRPLGEPHKHGDNHAMAFRPGEPDYLLVGSDGGVYETFDHGRNWRYMQNLPITQFYKVAVDYDLPFYNVIGGTQDNNTQYGPSRTRSVSGIVNNDWLVTVGGDGYSCAIDPEDPDTIYSEWQNGGMVRYDRRTGETIDIKPQESPGEEPYRWNWDAPILISPHSHTRLYFAAQKVFRSDDRGNSWKAISPDLSRGVDRLRQQKFMGKSWGADAIWDNDAMSWFSNITALAESPLVEGLIYAGTDDGLIQVTRDGGATWRKIDRPAGVPATCFVNDIKASLHDADTVYAALDNHKEGDFKPYIVRSTDRGRTWTSMSGDLPDRHLIWVVAQDHVKADLFFAGTEFGVFFSPDAGAHWVKLSGGMPTISVRDMEIQKRENDLVVATFGRGFYILDDYSPLRQVTAETFTKPASFFPVKDALVYVQSTPFGGREKGSQGASFYTAPNPPFGAVFTYYLSEPLKSARQARQERDREARKKGEGEVFPSWDELRVEDTEETPSLVLTVRDGNGNVVRRLDAPNAKGFQRVAWDVRFAAVTPTRLSTGELEWWRRGRSGRLAAPGTYTVTLDKLSDGIYSAMTEPVSFKTVPLGASMLTSDDRDRVFAFMEKTEALQRAATSAESVLDEALERVKYIEQSLHDAPKADPALRAEVRRIELGLLEVQRALVVDMTVRGRSEPATPSITDRISTVIGGHWFTTSAPTQTMLDQYAYAAQEFGPVLAKLRTLVETDLKALGEKMESAGTPWVPGHGLPQWKP